MNRLIVLAVILVVLGIIVVGGIKRIARSAEFIVPFIGGGLYHSCLCSNGDAY